MRLEIDIAEHHYNNIMALDSVSLGRVPYKGIIMYSINAIKHGKVLAQEPTKNNLGVEKTDMIDKSNFSQEQYKVDLQSAYDCGYEQAKNDFAVDLISRADALDCVNWGYSFSDIYKKINELPPVTPQPRWIPVSEKLPNDRNWYLGIFKEPDTGWINPLPFICDYVGRETKATTKEYWILHGFTDMDEHIDYYFNLECVAWMSLPQTYSEVEE